MASQPFTFTEAALSAYITDKPFVHYKDSTSVNDANSSAYNPWNENQDSQVVPSLGSEGMSSPGTVCLNQIESLDTDALALTCKKPDPIVRKEIARVDFFEKFGELTEVRREVRENSVNEKGLTAVDTVQDSRITALESRNGDLETRLVGLESIFSSLSTKIAAIADADWQALETKVLKAEILAQQQQTLINAQEQAMLDASVIVNGSDGLAAKIAGISSTGYLQQAAIDLSENSTLIQTITDSAGLDPYMTEAILAGAVKEDYFYTNLILKPIRGNTELYRFCLAKDETAEFFTVLTGAQLRRGTGMDGAELSSTPDCQLCPVSSNENMIVDFTLRGDSYALFYRVNEAEEDGSVYEVKELGGTTSDRRRGGYAPRSIQSGYKVYSNTSAKSGVVLETTPPECE